MLYADSPTVILGADGFFGRNLREYWHARGWPVYSVGRAAGDFTDPVAVAAAFRAAPRDARRILHAITKQRTGKIQYAIQGELLADNARIHLNVLDAWRRHLPGAKLISLGSSCVYPQSPHPIPESAFRSGAPHPSVHGYALAKELLAIGCETYGAQYGLSWLHCILATSYGPFAHTAPERSHFMAALIARAARGKAAGDTEFEVWGSPGTVRDLLFVTDQIEAIIAADAAFSDTILNVTTNAPVTIGACAKTLLAVLNWPARIVYPAGSFQGADYKSLDSTRFLAATGWRPAVGLAEGVRRTLASDLLQHRIE
jgi:nucleoside-diphosphate-sugar epimerase